MSSNENYGRGFDLFDEAVALKAEMLDLPERLEAVRRAESSAYQAHRDAKEAYELTVTNETMAHPEALAGNNDRDRKRAENEFLLHNVAIVAAHREVNAAEGHYLDAQIETKRITDTMAVVRNAARLLAAMLEYIASENNVTAAEQHATAATRPAF